MADASVLMPALVFLGVVVSAWGACAMQNNKEGDHEQYEDSFARAKHRTKASTEKTKHQASEKADDFKHQAEKAKHEVAKVIPQPVKDTADTISDKAQQAKVTTQPKSVAMILIAADNPDAT